MSTIRELAQNAATIVQSEAIAFYRNDPAEFKADQIAPRKSVRKAVGTWGLVDNDTGAVVTDVGRTAGQKAVELTQDFGKGVQYHCVERTVKVPVTLEDILHADSDFGYDAMQSAAQYAVEKVALEREYRVVPAFTSVLPATWAYDAATAATLYDNVAGQVVNLAGDWNGAGTPMADIDTALTWFENNSPVSPKEIHMSRGVALALRGNAEYIAEYGSQRDLQPVGGVAETIRDLKVVIHTAKAEIAGTYQSIWGDNVWIGDAGGTVGPNYKGHAIQLFAPDEVADWPVDESRVYAQTETGEFGTQVRIFPHQEVDRGIIYVQIKLPHDCVIIPRPALSLSGYLMYNALT